MASYRSMSPAARYAWSASVALRCARPLRQVASSRSPSGRMVVRQKSAARPAASAKRASPSTVAAWASAEIIRPFQATSTLSSVAGCTRRSRTARSCLRRGSSDAASVPACSPSSRSSSASGRGRTGTQWPSKLGVSPKSQATSRIAMPCSPTSAATSSRSQRKNLPSSPSLSASWVEKNAPVSEVISSSTHSQHSRATRAKSSRPVMRCASR